MQYKVIEASKPLDLEILVNNGLKHGGQLIGGVNIVRDKNFHDRYSQAMLIKTE